LLDGSFIFCMLFTWLQDSKQLTVTNVKSLKMDEDVLAVSIGNSQVGKQHIAIALLDCTVKVCSDTCPHDFSLPFVSLFNWKSRTTLHLIVIGAVWICLPCSNPQSIICLHM
jgi:hypothetical protein